MHYTYESEKVNQTFRDPLSSDYVLKSAKILLFSDENGLMSSISFNVEPQTRPPWQVYRGRSWTPRIQEQDRRSAFNITWRCKRITTGATETQQQFPLYCCWLIHIHTYQQYSIRVAMETQQRFSLYCCWLIHIYTYQQYSIRVAIEMQQRFSLYCCWQQYIFNNISAQRCHGKETTVLFVLLLTYTSLNNISAQRCYWNVKTVLFLLLMIYIYIISTI